MYRVCSRKWFCFVVVLPIVFLAVSVVGAQLGNAPSQAEDPEREYHGIIVEPFTLPEAGIDRVRIELVETYDIEGVGRDTVTLTGMLVTRRLTPLLAHGTTEVSWETSTVFAVFDELNVEGRSDLFGDVFVTLDPSEPSGGGVHHAVCAAALSVIVTMPQLGLILTTEEPVQLQSTVQTVPPIGDEKTVSVKPVALVDDTGRNRGTLEKVRVLWRELVSQETF